MKLPEIVIITQDITTLEVDAIVNAANSALSGGGGVDGAIHRAAGPELAEACRKLGRCPTGEAVITKGFKLPAKYVIHAVGPVWWGGNKNERQLLASCYQRSLELAARYQLDSIAFSAISCGIYGFPVDEAAQIAIDTVAAFAKSQQDCPSRIYLVCFDPKVKEAYERYFASKPS
jgi:O-acetyl-ADP-ribose deacetylase (regulator of RNase III)